MLGTLVLVVAASYACARTQHDTAATTAASATNSSKRYVRFAVIGDYGQTTESARAVADLVKGWKPQFVITTGDNNYPSGAASTIDGNVGRYYHRFIFPYTGRFGIGATRNRFFPSLGNHDWHAADAKPYLDYFTLPGNERYYDFTAGPIHFLALDSDPHEPDGVSSSSRQAEWLRERLRHSSSCWHLVYFHHAPYSSGEKRPSDWMRWPFGPMHVDVVLSGHEHSYERLVVGGVDYFVVGLGGAGIYRFKDEPLAGSQKRYNRDHGAMLVSASRDHMTFTFVTSTGAVVDTHEISKHCSPASERGAASRSIAPARG